ncbi:uncharacterized protein [Primulina eburnea]|uniref:uncharacterized protein isoform X3 n=1 Tax=Primulina eburnea TaxID=1245227 RepID=UPI003C6C4EAE
MPERGSILLSYMKLSTVVKDTYFHTSNLQMAKQPQYFFLEEWLRNTIITGNNKSGLVHPSSSSAQAIIQAWADIRDSLQCQSFNAHHLQALKLLVSSQASLHVADPQAKLLLSILSLQNLSLPQETYLLFFRLLYIWLRKSRQSSQVVESAIDILLHLLSFQSHSDRSPLFLSEGILLLGAISFQTSLTDKSKRVCLEFLCKLLEEDCRDILLSDELVSNVLAGIGYALSSSISTYFGKILDILFRIWGQEDGPSGTISQGLMLLHLIEWVLSNSLRSQSLDKIDLVKGALETVIPSHSSFAVVMAAAGTLRAINRSGLSGFMHLANAAEGRIEILARDLVSRTECIGHSENNPKLNLLLQCIALALARSGSVAYRDSLLVSLSLALLTEVFPLQRIYDKVVKLPKENLNLVLNEIEEHISSVIFKEAGAITRILCNQYASANEDTRGFVENLIWDYCQKIYLWHRQATLVLLGCQDKLISELEKISESTFLMVVVFSLGVTKHRLDSRVNQEIQLQISVRILIALSCMEYFRRMRLPEYMDTIRAVIVSVQENESACVSFVESIPSYDDLIHNHGSSKMAKLRSVWSTDEVQTARIIFYMRVIPTCIEQLPAPVFRKVVAPTMFLFLGHPNGKVARYAHSMFVAFISSGKDPSQNERDSLKEQLVYYYMQRSLEAFPGITPLEGMASGVVALVRYLPAGCPSIFYCIHCLVEKVNTLCSAVNREDIDLWKHWEGELEPSKKVLPSLMKLLAQLIVQLPVNGQNMLLNQLYQQIAESDDVIRKPALISWLQSLSYLCSQAVGKKEPDLVGEITSRL